MGIHGANRLGSNSLAEIVVFGKLAGERAVQHAKAAPAGRPNRAQAGRPRRARLLAMLGRDKGAPTTIREMHEAMKTGGIYRLEHAGGVRQARELRDRYRRGLKLDDRNRAFNTEWLSAIELGFTSRSPR